MAPQAKNFRIYAGEGIEVAIEVAIEVHIVLGAPQAKKTLRILQARL